MTIQTRANIEPEGEPDAQGHLKTVHLSDDSSNELQNPWNADETASETEIDFDASHISQGRTCGRRLADREMVNDLWSESQPPPDHRRYLL